MTSVQQVTQSSPTGSAMRGSFGYPAESQSVMGSSILALVVVSLVVPAPRWNLVLEVPGAGIMRIQRDTSDNPAHVPLNNGPVDAAYNLVGVGLERIVRGGWTVGGSASAWGTRGGIDIHAGLLGGIRRTLVLVPAWELALDGGVGPSFVSKSYNAFKLEGFGGQHTLLVGGRIGAEIDRLGVCCA